MGGSISASGDLATDGGRVCSTAPVNGRFVVLVGCLACKAPLDGDYKVVVGVEPTNTCAIEGYLRGGSLSARTTPIVVVLEWKENGASGEGGGLYATTATNRRFRVAAVPCDTPRVFTIAVMTDAHEGGAIHTTLAGNYDSLFAHSGDRLTNVRVDLTKGESFHGTVKDIGGAPLEGVTVSATYTSSSYGWSGPPKEFSRSDATGRWSLDGVTPSRYADPSHPSLMFYKTGYRALSEPTSASAIDAVLEKQ